LPWSAGCWGGCTAGEVELYEPEGSGLGQGLTVKVELDSTAADIAEALGWTEGVPGAEVRVHRLGTEFRWLTVLTDSAGEVRLPSLIPGTYRVAAYRVLTDEEAAQLGGRRRAFADGTIVHLSQPLARTLRMTADEPGSILISEVYATAPYVAEIQYDYHMFFELYNNSEIAVFLDGMIFGETYGPARSDIEEFPCEASAHVRNDPDAIWAVYFHRFPSTGAEYPLAPGEAAVIAVDAVDHSAVDPRFPDLTHADFELLGPGDVDNPAVPNLPEVGVRTSARGHGLWLGIGKTYFVSRPVDLEGLERRVIRPPYPDEAVGFPREAILDVVATEDNDAREEQLYPMCDEMVHRNFDRLAGGFIKHGEDLEYSVQRVVIDTTPDGRAILQDTNTSAVDLVRALYTPGTLPQAPGF
jgi:hypothetical protein